MSEFSIKQYKNEVEKIIQTSSAFPIFLVIMPRSKILFNYKNPAIYFNYKFIAK